MLAWLEQLLVRYPELALFLVLAPAIGSETSKLGCLVLDRLQALFSLGF